jgi:predicted nuclease of predicted toxin-antitoxin system
MQPDWEIWLDSHISPIVAKWLKEQSGFNIKSSYVLQLYNLSDLEIYLKAKKHGNIILISKDSDLPEIISKSGSHPKLIVLKIPNCDNKILYYSQSWNVTYPDVFAYYSTLIKI